jgi:diguanylate cyclase (GGDEF)-like protein
VVFADAVYGLDRRCQLWRLQPAPVTALPTGFADDASCVALASSEAGLWVGSTEHGVLRLDPVSGQAQRWAPDQLAVSGARLSALGALRSGGLLLGFADGALSRLQPGGSSRALPLRLSAPIGSRITTLLEQTGGTLWIGTYASGLLRAGTLSAALLAGPAGDAVSGGWPTSSIYAVWREDGLTLLGTDRGLLRHDGDTPGWSEVASIGRRSVRRILPDPAGGWWIGTLDGLWRLRADYSAERIEGLVDQRVSDLLFQGARLWVSTRNGLGWVEANRASQLGVPDALRRGFLTALLADSSGSLWIGSNEGGLRVLTGDGGMRWLHRGNGRLTNDSVWSLHAHEGWVYVGSHGGGLQRLRLDDESVWHMGVRDGLSNNVIYRIESDSRGRLWLSTNRGLNVVEPGRRQAQVLRESDGLANTEYNAGASFRDERGRLYFGGTEGLDAVDPGAIPESAGNAQPRLSRLEVVGDAQSPRGAEDPDWKAISLRPPLHFDWQQRVLDATLVALDFSAPGSARLRYRLLGLNEEWIEPRTPRSEVLLSGLQHGDYVLELQAAGRDGEFGDTHHVALSIAPPPWASPLAYGLYLLVAIGLLLAAWLRVRQLDRDKQARLEQLNLLVAQRTADLETANLQLRRNNAMLDQAGRTDPLTRVSNRRDLHEWLESRQEALLAEARSGGRGLLFCLVDLDDFKQVNDRFGHRAGDEVLVSFAGRLREQCRDGDLVVRWGGEEFLIVLRAGRGTDIDALLDRLMLHATAPISVAGQGNIPMGCSIGVAAWPFAIDLEAGEWEHSVWLADRALYRAKAEGKRAWQWWRAGPGLDATALSKLLDGVEPEHLPSGTVSIQRGTGPQRSETEG